MKEKEAAQRNQLQCQTNRLYNQSVSVCGSACYRNEQRQMCPSLTFMTIKQKHNLR